MKNLLKFKIFAHRGPLKTWNMAKSRYWSRDENFQFNIFAHRGPVKTWNMAKSRNWSRDEKFAQI